MSASNFFTKSIGSLLILTFLAEGPLNADESYRPLETSLFVGFGGSYGGSEVHSGDLPGDSEARTGGFAPGGTLGGSTLWSYGITWEMAYALRAPIDASIVIRGGNAMPSAVLCHEMYLGPSYTHEFDSGLNLGFGVLPGIALLSPVAGPDFRAVFGFLDTEFFSTFTLSEKLLLKASIGARFYRGLSGSAVGEDPHPGTAGPPVSVDGQGAVPLVRLDLRWNFRRN